MQGIANFYQTLPSGYRQLLVNILSDVEDASAEKLLDSLSERISVLETKISRAEQKRAAWRKSLEDTTMMLEQLDRYCSRNSTPDVELLRDALVNRSGELDELISRWDPKEHLDKATTLKHLKEKLLQRRKCAEELKKLCFEQDEKLSSKTPEGVTSRAE